MINTDRKIPECLREGHTLSRLSLRDMNIVDVAKAYAYELWRSESTSSSYVNILVDEIEKLGGQRADSDHKIDDLEDEIGGLECSLDDADDERGDLEDEISTLHEKIGDLEDSIAFLEGKSDADC